MRTRSQDRRVCDPRHGWPALSTPSSGRSLTSTVSIRRHGTNAGSGGDDDHYQWWGWECHEIPDRSRRNRGQLHDLSHHRSGRTNPASRRHFVQAWRQRCTRKRDTWYRDMREPGFAGDEAPCRTPTQSLPWLADRIVADDPRFAEADGQVLVAGHHGHRCRVSRRRRRGRRRLRGPRCLASNVRRPTEVKRLAARLPARVPRRVGLQPEGPAGGDGPAPVVPLRVHCHPRRSVAQDRCCCGTQVQVRLLTPEELGRKTVGPHRVPVGAGIRNPESCVHAEPSARGAGQDGLTG